LLGVARTSGTADLNGYSFTRTRCVAGCTSTALGAATLIARLSHTKGAQTFGSGGPRAVQLGARFDF
jgi:hypothetical protein